MHINIKMQYKQVTTVMNSLLFKRCQNPRQSTCTRMV